MLGNLSACGNESNPIIESSAIELQDVENSDTEVLRFSVYISDINMETDQHFSVRFLVQNPYIKNLIKTNEIDVTDRLFTSTKIDRENGKSKSFSVWKTQEIRQEFSVHEIKENIEERESVIVELYSGEEIIARDIISSFEDVRK